MTVFNKILFFVLLAAIVICIGSIIFVATIANKADSFTEFYLLNANGKAADYPYMVKAGEPANIIIGVVNHEKKPIDYKIVISIGEVNIKTIRTGTLQNDQKWEQNISFAPVTIGNNQRVKFSIFANDDATALQKDPLTLTIDVTN
ncbi:MAG: DUF1616 domain-containing protein [Chloroflexi bacterium]|nr:DUF1616 domain-containing protein [Chloroflexota bacterium]